MTIFITTFINWILNKQTAASCIKVAKRKLTDWKWLAQGETRRGKRQLDLRHFLSLYGPGLWQSLEIRQKRQGFKAAEAGSVQNGAAPPFAPFSRALGFGIFFSDDLVKARLRCAKTTAIMSTMAKRQRKSGHRAAKAAAKRAPKAYAKAVLHLNLSKMAEGTKVSHRTYGDGVISVIDKPGKYVVVRFGMDEKKFCFPEAFTSGFLTFQEE